MDKNTVRLWLKDHQDAAKKLVRQQAEAFQLQLDTLRTELQSTRGLLQNRQGGGEQSPQSMRLDVLKNGLITTWSKFEESMKNCFGPSKYEDPRRGVGAVSNLLQLDTTLTLPSEEASPVAKGPLDVSKDTLLSLRSEDPNFKIQEKAVKYVRALNAAPLKVVFAGPVDEVLGKFSKFSKDKGCVEK
nr:hypothetical protein [Tanacetum cinerariifolium]